MPRDEILRVVTLSRGGRPQVALDLAQGDGYLSGRGTFTIEPGERGTVTVEQGGRYGGERAVGEHLPNATASGTWYVQGSSADAAITNLRALLRELESPQPGRYVEWRPPSVSHSVLLERRGPASWKPNYKRAWWKGSHLVGFDVSWPIAPVQTQLPMDVIDDFAEDTITDYLFDAGTGTLSVSVGALVPSDNSTKRIVHVARGYTYGDVQGTLAVQTGASVTGSVNGPELCRIDAANYLIGVLRESTVAILKSEGGTLSSPLASTAFTPDPNTDYWVVFRKVGATLTVEVYSQVPTPLGIPDAFATYTLSPTEQETFGTEAEGLAGAYLIPGGTDWRYPELRIEPFTYRDVLAPAVIQMHGNVPGDTEALVDFCLTHADVQAPWWGMIGWTPRVPPGLAQSPFGIITADSADTISNWIVTAQAGSLGGTMLMDSAVSGAEDYTAGYFIDPTVLTDPDEFESNELVLEVWARAWIGSSLVSPRLVASLAPQDVSGPEQFTSEFGSAGRVLVNPVVGALQFTRLGTLVVGIDPERPHREMLRIEGQVAPGSTGKFGLDYLLLVKAHARCAGPTGKPQDASYPQLFGSPSELTKVLGSDGRAIVLDPVFNRPSRDHALGGSLPRLALGQNDVCVKLSSNVPDSPTPPTAVEKLTHDVALHCRVTPRRLFV